MKKQLLLLTIAFTSACAWAQTRFVDNVLSPSQISVTPNVTYAQNYTVLYGDIDYKTWTSIQVRVIENGYLCSN